MRPLVDAPLTAADLDAVKADAETYPDGDRPRTRAEGEAMLAHDRDLATGVQALLNRGGSEATLVAAAADLLASDRRTIEQMLSDVRLLRDSADDARSLEQGERALGQALEAWRGGQPVAAVAHFRQAADRAWDVLDRHDVSYDPDADLDGDGVPDILELRAGADPRVTDTDGDGLTDRFEILEGLPYHHPGDPDGDGLSDLREMEIGSDPADVNTDGDGRDDGFEDGNRDADFDPLVPTQEMSKWEYAGDFALGAGCGELLGACERD